MEKVVPREALRGDSKVLKSKLCQMLSYKQAHMLLDGALCACLGVASLPKMDQCSHGRSLRVYTEVMNL